MATQPTLDFTQVIPRAANGLGGLPRARFSNGRLCATVGAHGGLLEVAWWGEQRMRASLFFQGNPGTGWTKLFRFCLMIDSARYYPTLTDTQFHPFGLRARASVGNIVFRYELLLLPDALVQRAALEQNPDNRSIGVELIHQESATAVNLANRTWNHLVFDDARNALIAACTDENPDKGNSILTEASLAQRELGLLPPDSPRATTWIAFGSDHRIQHRRGYHARSKHYLVIPPRAAGDVAQEPVSACIVFSPTEKKLHDRLAQIARPGQLNAECDQLLIDARSRQSRRPRIATGSLVHDSAFSQFPESIHCCRLSDTPGAVRANNSHYFIWGWDAMTTFISNPLSNEASHTADLLRFLHNTRHPRIGIPHRFTTTFAPCMRGPWPAQAQFIAGLYLHVAATGDYSVAREVWPTVTAILDHCRETRVGDTGLVAGPALWPDFPEAMEETGRDIAAINNSILYQALRGTGHMARVLGHDALAEECSTWAAALRTHFIRYLYDVEKGFFISSCSADDFTPRRHYCPQSIFWITPHARELIQHDPARIANFMDAHLRSARCLLTLPHWDTAWMADGNQLGSSFPYADLFYLNAHKHAAARLSPSVTDTAIDAWLGDVAWHWSFLSAPEAFTPEAENEHELGPDNIGNRQQQACTAWYVGALLGLGCFDYDHEGLHLAPWGSRPVKISGLRLRGTAIDILVTGRGPYFSSIKLNGVSLPPNTRFIPWTALTAAPEARLELVRWPQPPDPAAVAVSSCAAVRAV